MNASFRRIPPGSSRRGNSPAQLGIAKFISNDSLNETARHQDTTYDAFLEQQKCGGSLAH